MAAIHDIDVGGARLSVIDVAGPSDLAAGLRDAGVATAAPVVVLVGGAAGLSASDRTALEPVITAVVDLVVSLGAVVVDGGTDAGVMRMMGDARRAAGADFHLVGVAARGTVVLPGRTAADHAADPDGGHSHLVLVPGDRWGDEAPWIARTATTVAAGAPSVTLLANGGEIAYLDVEQSLAAGRSVIVLAGSGRASDDLAAAVHGSGGASERARRLVRSGPIAVVPLGPVAPLVDAVRTALG